MKFIETHARAFLALIILSIGTVLNDKTYTLPINPGLCPSCLFLFETGGSWKTSMDWKSPELVQANVNGFYTKVV